MTRKRNYSPEYKAKVVRELVEGDDSVSVVAAKYHLNANMVSGWRRQLFDNADVVFSQEQVIRENLEAEAAHREEVDNLNRIIGQLTVERDYLQRGVRENLDRRGL